jgi:hypothetical protein
LRFARNDFDTRRRSSIKIPGNCTPGGMLLTFRHKQKKHK